VPEKLAIFCEDEEIQFTSYGKLLGLMIDENLKWDHHIKNVCTKLNRAI
jgi:hypothetical protein